jgi:cytosine/creatinine deaminase
MENKFYLSMETKSDWEEETRKFANSFGGFFNAHAHADRGFTRKDEYYEHIGKSVSELERLPLKAKQSLVWALHQSPAFDPENIEKRLRRVLDTSIKFGVKRLDSCIDVTYNVKLNAWEVAEKLKKEYAKKIDFRIGAYNVAGFKDSHPERFELFEEAAKRADFIVALAEKDEKPGHIGERQHNFYMLNLGLKLEKPVHFHVDQGNSSEENLTENLLEDMKCVYDLEHRLKKYPKTKAVHVISPSCYEENRFQKLCEGLQRYEVGVIVCPSAGISMKLNRKQKVPNHNSLARMWDFALREIPVFLGTDNINDVFVPSSTPDLFDEIKEISGHLRFYSPRILAKIASGLSLDDFDRSTIRSSLYPPKE